MSAYQLPNGDGIDLGTRVRFTATLTRRFENRPAEAYQPEGWKVWKRHDAQPTEGLVIGVRTLVNGVNHYSGYDEPIEFEPRERLRAVLVAHHLGRRPSLVPFDALVVLNALSPAVPL